MTEWGFLAFTLVICFVGSGETYRKYKRNLGQGMNKFEAEVVSTLDTIRVLLCILILLIAAIFHTVTGAK